MKLLTIDFETYYDKEYSLSKMTTEEYIRDSRFEAIGVSVQEGELSSVWFSGTHAQIKQFLAQYDWQNAAALAHNAMFDMAILNWHFGIKPKKVADTLSMARALHTIEVGGSLAALAEYYGLGAKGTEVGDALGKRRLDFTAEELARYGEYCKNDVALTYKLFGRLAQGFPVSELNLIDLTIRMFSEPVIELDAGVLELNLKNVREAKRVALAKAMIDKDQLMSNDQLAELLRSLGVQPPTKISPTTGKQVYAFAKTDEAFLELLEHDNLHVQALAAARLGVKSTIEESRTERLLSIASRGLMPVPLRYYAAHTGRWGGCLVDDTEVLVYDVAAGVQTKRIVDVLLDDLVWDGEAFVPHEGVVFSGFSEVIKWDGITGTEDHVVFTDAGEISLRDALQGGHRLKTANSPTQDAVDAARQLAGVYKKQTPL
jgi:DNA polymerase